MLFKCSTRCFIRCQGKVHQYNKDWKIYSITNNFYLAYMHQKRREWEKKQKKFKNVANFNVPVLFASSEGLYLRLIDDEFGPGSVPNNDLDNNVSKKILLQKD